MGLKHAGLVALAVGLAACGGGGVAKEDFGARVLEALCARHERCGEYASAEACQQNLGQWYEDAWFGLGTRHDAALASGRLRFDEDAAERCVEALRESDCREPQLSRAVFQRGIEYAPDCPVLRVEEPGADCQSDLECGEQGFCGHSATHDCQGHCEPRAGEGQPYSSPWGCEPGLAPWFGGRCERPAEEGASCVVPQGDMTATLPCEEGLWCDASESGQCQRLRAEGEACGGDGAPWCEAHLACKEGRCGLPSREGEPCRAPTPSILQQAPACQQQLFCDADAGQPGTCRKYREEGAACRGFADCGPDMRCNGAEPQSGVWGTCEKRPGPGAACDTRFMYSGCGPGLACSQQHARCVPLVHGGEPCGLVGECDLSSVCSDEGRCIPAEAARCG